MDRFKIVFRGQQKALVKLNRQVLKKFNPDDIHDLRIMLRRFRITLKMLEHLTSKKIRPTFKNELKKSLDAMSKIRNIDEAALFVNRRSISCKNIRKKLGKMRNPEIKSIKKRLRSLNYNLDKYAGALNTAPFTEAKQLKYIRKRFNHYRKSSRIIMHRRKIFKKPELLHRLRISIRKWRYFLEMVSDILEENYDSHIKLLKKYQSILGKINNMEVFKILFKNMKLAHSEKIFLEKCAAKEEKKLLRRFELQVKTKLNLL